MGDQGRDRERVRDRTPSRHPWNTILNHTQKSTQSNTKLIMSLTCLKLFNYFPLLLRKKSQLLNMPVRHFLTMHISPQLTHTAIFCSGNTPVSAPSPGPYATRHPTWNAIFLCKLSTSHISGFNSIVTFSERFCVSPLDHITSKAFT